MSLPAETTGVPQPFTQGCMPARKHFKPVDVCLYSTAGNTTVTGSMMDIQDIHIEEVDNWAWLRRFKETSDIRYKIMVAKVGWF